MKNIAIIGNPNVGKSTLFNVLTEGSSHVVNFPGSTVTTQLGSAAAGGKKNDDINIYDTPGLYGLTPLTAEERLTYHLIFSKKMIDGVIVLVESHQLERKLVQFSKLQKAGVPFAVVVKKDNNPHLAKQVHRCQTYFKVPFIFYDDLVKDKTAFLHVIDNLPARTNYQKPVEYDKKTFFKEHNFLKENIFGDAFSTKTKEIPQLKADKLFFHPLWGSLIFTAVLFTVFSCVFWLASPFLEYLDVFFTDISQYLNDTLGDSLGALFISKGVVVAFGATTLFLPQIFLLYMFTGLLEQSGYLARAAAFLDRPLQKLGISGRAFLPLLSGFGCAIPAIFTTRVMSNYREKLLTVMAIPLLVCSARLPIYGLILGFFFHGHSSFLVGGILTGLYILSILNAVVALWLLNKTQRRPRSSLFMLELPSYRLPRLKEIIFNAFNQCQSYIRNAAPLIFAFSVGIFALSNLPYDKELNEAERFRQSYLARVGKTIEPVFEPMGVDWRVGTGLLSAFVAREVFISTQALLFMPRQEAEGDEPPEKSLLKSLKQVKKTDGTPLFNKANLLALLVFFTYALQCFSTTVVTARETRSWRIAAIQFAALNGLAYVLAVLTYQIFSRIFAI